MRYTSERFIPDAKDADKCHLKRSEQEHLNRYRYALKWVKGKKILDAACGTGYGTFTLSKEAQKAIGVDIDTKTISYAKQHYKSSNLSFFVGDLEKHLPFQDQAFDVVISFETIEHLHKPREFLCEAKRVLKKNGIFLGSTPRKSEHLHSQFHIKEYTHKQLKQLLDEFFANTLILRQSNVYGSLIGPLEIHGGDKNKVNLQIIRDFGNSDVFIFICSEVSISEEKEFLIDLNDDDHVRHLEKELSLLQYEVQKRDSQIKYLERKLSPFRRIKRLIYWFIS